MFEVFLQMFGLMKSRVTLRDAVELKILMGKIKMNHPLHQLITSLRGTLRIPYMVKITIDVKIVI